jgi:hypothetical protein
VSDAARLTKFVKSGAQYRRLSEQVSGYCLDFVKRFRLGQGRRNGVKGEIALPPKGLGR